MKSPFPGMDPFIEAFDLWRDFHDKLIGDLERELSDRARYAIDSDYASSISPALSKGELERLTATSRRMGRKVDR